MKLNIQVPTYYIIKRLYNETKKYLEEFGVQKNIYNINEEEFKVLTTSELYQKLLVSTEDLLEQIEISYQFIKSDAINSLTYVKNLD